MTVTKSDAAYKVGAQLEVRCSKRRKLNSKMHQVCLYLNYYWRSTLFFDSFYVSCGGLRVLFADIISHHDGFPLFSGSYNSDLIGDLHRCYWYTLQSNLILEPMQLMTLEINSTITLKKQVPCILTIQFVKVQSFVTKTRANHPKKLFTDMDQTNCNDATTVNDHLGSQWSASACQKELVWAKSHV